MKYITSKEVKKYIISYNDLDKLSEFLDTNYKATTEGIFNALFILIKNPDKNKSEINKLIILLKEQLNRNSYNELKHIISLIIDFQNKMSKLKVKERIKIREYSSELQNLFNDIHRKISDNTNNNQIKCLEFLIFHDKNIQMIEQFIKNNKSILDKKQLQEEHIFLKVLKKYITSTNEDEINYFYHIIMIFLKNNIGKEILKKEYLNIYKQENNYPKHILRLLELSNPKLTIDNKELEERHKIHFSFPNIILNEIETFKPKNILRHDFTKQNALTIDGELTTCYDDALFIEKNDNDTYTLYIHIIDIPSWIPFSSKTREEASFREENIYTKDKIFLLYPSNICNDKCSLIKNQPRNTISYIFTLDKELRVIPDSFKIVPGIINVSNKMTYEEADSVIKNNLDNNLLLLYKFSNTRRKDTIKKESYRNYENILFLENHHESTKVDSSPSANIIHESMILVNYYVAKYFKDNKIPYIYRKLNIPSPEFIEQQLKILKDLGTNIEKNKEFINNLKDSYIKAVYCSKPTYHKGLNLECYSHSTSPARRYIDSLGQYIIHDLLIDKNIQDQNIYTWENTINNAIKHANSKKKQHEIFENEYNYLL